MNTKNKVSNAYKNKLKYIRDYEKEHAKIFSIRFDKEKDKELIDFLSSQNNKAQTIREMYEAYKKGL